MKLQPSMNIASYVKYVGVPISVGVAMCGLFKCLSRKAKRRAALEGKVVVITGASSGLGEALAHALYNEGSRVVLAARRVEELERVKQNLVSKRLETPTLEPIVIKLDLGDTDHIADFVKEVHEKCGKVDILINNGGVSFRGSILDTGIDVDQRIMGINYFGSVALTKAFLPEMVKNKSGHIVFVSSVQGLIAIPDRAAYAASKHALQAFGDSLRAEMHQHNVNVTVVSPGYVVTNISLNALTGSGGNHGVMDKETAAGFTAEYVAQKMLDSIVDKKEELVVSQFLPNVAIFLRHFAPKVYFYFMIRRAKKTSID